ncbi:MAG: tRNA pseudouridine synthase A [Chlamydiales bacterium]|nr:tRNA pseudouridine synthase A [Chlamydiales bacterium]
MHNICLVIAYDGTPFLGWQKTGHGASVEEALQSVLEQILQEPIQLQAASRTDRGVHAQGQVVNFFTHKNPPKAISLNRLLPSTIRVLAVKHMPPDFHPSLDAKGKLYTYSLNWGPIQLPFDRLYAWHVPYALDIQEMKTAARHLIGEHDFSAFCKNHPGAQYAHTRRHIESIEIARQDPGQLKIAIRGNHFLYKMVRALVGTLVHVGRGKLKSDAIPRILASHAREEAGQTAPAHGLTLEEIYF